MKEKSNKNEYIQIRLTCKEKELLKEEALKKGIPMSKLIRESLFNKLVHF